MTPESRGKQVVCTGPLFDFSEKHDLDRVRTRMTAELPPFRWPISDPTDFVDGPVCNDDSPGLRLVHHQHRIGLHALSLGLQRGS